MNNVMEIIDINFMWYTYQMIVSLEYVLYAFQTLLIGWVAWGSEVGWLGVVQACCLNLTSVLVHFESLDNLFCLCSGYNSRVFCEDYK